MKLTAVAVVILAIGIVVGFALAGGTSGGPASAVPQCPGPSSQCATPTPAPPQQREDQITLFAESGSSGRSLHCSGCSPSDWSFLASEDYPIMALDANDYPPTSSFRLDATFDDHSAFAEGCMRLFNLTETAGISESEVCYNAGSVPVDLIHLRSGPFQIPDEEHEYALQSRGTGGLGKSAFIIVEWTE